MWPTAVSSFCWSDAGGVCSSTSRALAMRAFSQMTAATSGSSKMVSREATESRSMRTSGCSSSTQRNRNSGIARSCAASSLESQPHGISSSISSVIAMSFLMCSAAARKSSRAARSLGIGLSFHGPV